MDEWAFIRDAHGNIARYRYGFLDDGDRVKPVAAFCRDAKCAMCGKKGAPFIVVRKNDAFAWCGDHWDGGG